MAPETSSNLAASPLRYRDFRVLWSSGLAAGLGFQAETVVLGWLLLDRTDSPFVVGVGVALRALPNFLFGIPGGALADRMDRRALIRIVGLAAGLAAAVAGVLELAGLLSVGLVLVLTFIAGTARSLGQTARISYGIDVAGPAKVISGTALLSLAQRAGSLLGALGAGAMLEESGPGAAYLAIALAQLVSVVILFWARSTGQAAPTARLPVWEGVREFVTEIGHNRRLALLVLLAAAVEVLGFSYQSLMPSVARDVLDLGGGGLGLLTAFGSASAMVTILIVTTRGEIGHAGLGFLLVMLAFGAGMVLLRASNALAIALTALALINSMAALSDLLSQSLVQAAVVNNLRGRAMGSWLLAIGFGPVGHVQIGALAALAGVTTALITNGLLLLVLATVALFTARSVRRS